MRKTPFLRQNEIDVALSQKRLIFLRRFFQYFHSFFIQFWLHNNILHIFLKKLKVFEKGSHTRIYADPECKDEYAEAVKEFLTN